MYVRTIIFCFLSGAQPRAQTTDSSTMQRACLPPTDYKTTALPPSSSSRQHHARVAGARCAMASCLYRSLRSITRRHHHLLCRCCRIIRAHARAQTTDNNSLVACREHAYPQLTTVQNYNPDAQKQQQAAPWACDRSALCSGYMLLSELAIDHPITPPPPLCRCLLLAMCNNAAVRSTYLRVLAARCCRCCGATQ